MNYTGRPHKDVCGLCSPGRWEPSKRNLEQPGSAYEIKCKLRALMHKHLDVKRTAYALFCGCFSDSPFRAEIIAGGMQVIVDMLRDMEPPL